jgi:O-antigen/teichoic acid export membrane protein
MSFFSRIKRLASETAIYGISSIVGRTVNFLLVPFYTQFFAPEQYGVVGLVYTAIVFLNIVYAYGLEGSYLKHASGSGREQVQEVFSTSIWSLLATSVLFTGAMILFREPVAMLIGIDVQWHFLLYYTAAILALDAVTVVPFAELRLANKALQFALIKFTNILVNVGMNILLIVVLDWGIEAIFVANLAASVVTLFLLMPVYLRLLRPTFSRSLWKAMLGFGLPFVPGGLGYAFAERVNMFFLAHMTGRDMLLERYGRYMSQESLDGLEREAETRVAELTANAAPGEMPSPERLSEAMDLVYGQYLAGVFNVVWKLGILMLLVVQMFRYAWQPFFLQHADDDDARELFARIFTLFTALGLAVFLGVSFFAYEIVSFPLPGGRHLIQPAYWLGLHIVPIALLAYLFEGWYYNFSVGAYVQKKTKYFIHATFTGAIVSLALNATLVPAFGLEGAAWATLAAWAVIALTLHLLLRRHYAIPYDWMRVAGMGALAAGLFALWYFIPPLQVWWAQAGLLAAFAGGLVLLGVVPLSLLKRLAASRR